MRASRGYGPAARPVTQKKQQERERGFEVVERGRVRRWIGRWGRSKQRDAPCTLCTERKRRPRLARTNPRSRESANREPNRSPIPKSAGSQAGSVVSEPPNCSDASSRGRFSSYDAFSRTRAILSVFDLHGRTDRSKWTKKIRSIEDRIDLKILDVASRERRG